MSDQVDRGVLGDDRLRELNDRIAQIAWGDDEPLTLHCECGGPFCANRVVLTHSRFLAMREDGQPVLAQGVTIGGRRSATQAEALNAPCEALERWARAAQIRM